MALAVRAQKLSLKAQASRRTAVKPVAALNAKVAAGVAASVAATAVAVAPVEAAQVISTVASATEGYPFVPPDWAPAVLIPLTCWVLPAVAMGWAFTWIEKEAPSSE